jgi:amino acid transporter
MSCVSVLPGDPPTAGRLTLWDAVSIIVGIVIGSTIFRSPPLIFGSVSGPWVGLAVWAVGGVLSLVGALCYAELATAYPCSGGDYVYLRRAYGPAVAFLFGWSQLTVVLTGSIGAMAFVFADYAAQLWKLSEGAAVLAAVLAVAGLSAVNALGIVFGKGMQNALTAAKLLGMSAIVVAGLGAEPHGPAAEPAPVGGGGLGLALILVLYAYGGWNDAAFVAAELRGRRSIARALLLGTAGITVIYLVVNAAYLRALGFEGVRQSPAVAAEVLGRLLGTFGERAMCLLVMICALGAINGMIFTGARVYATLGADYRRIGWLGRWDRNRGAPLGALAAQTAMSLALIAAVGTEAGRWLLDELLQSVGLEPLPWAEYQGGFNTLVAGTAPVFWGFFLLTGVALFLLRRIDPHVDRPFRTPLYPLVPLVFCASCAFMLYQAIRYAGTLSLLGAVPLALGLLPYAVVRRCGPGRTGPDNPLAARLPAAYDGSAGSVRDP